MTPNIAAIIAQMERWNCTASDVRKYADVPGFTHILAGVRANPTTIGKLCAYFDCDPEDITIPEPPIGTLDIYAMECAMAKEDLTYGDMRHRVGYNPREQAQRHQLAFTTVEKIAAACWAEPIALYAAENRRANGTE